MAGTIYQGSVKIQGGGGVNEEVVAEIATPIVNEHDVDTTAHEDIRALIDTKIEAAFANIAKAEEASF